MTERVATISDLALSPYIAVGRRTSAGRRLARLARRYPIGVLALLVLCALCLGALFAPQIAPYAPTNIQGKRLDAPSSEHLLGTDRIGRDMLSRILYGARVSLLVGFLAVTIGTVCGSAVGIISGFVGGWTDLV